MVSIRSCHCLSFAVFIFICWILSSDAGICVTIVLMCIRISCSANASAGDGWSTGDRDNASVSTNSSPLMCSAVN